MKIIKSVDKYGTIRYKNEYGQYHREDGPAIEFYDGDFRYYLNHTRYNKEEWENEILKIKLNKFKDL